jgi:hypothetical protein
MNVSEFILSLYIPFDRSDDMITRLPKRSITPLAASCGGMCSEHEHGNGQGGLDQVLPLIQRLISGGGDREGHKVIIIRKSEDDSGSGSDSPTTCPCCGQVRQDAGSTDSPSNSFRMITRT